MPMKKAVGAYPTAFKRKCSGLYLYCLIATMPPHAAAVPAENVAEATRKMFVVAVSTKRFGSVEPPATEVVVVLSWPIAAAVPSVGSVADVLLTPMELAVVVAEPKLMFTEPYTFQTPAVRLSVATFAAVAVVSDTAEPVGTSVERTSPVWPAATAVSDGPI